MPPIRSSTVQWKSVQFSGWKSFPIPAESFSNPVQKIIPLTASHFSSWPWEKELTRQGQKCHELEVELLARKTPCSLRNYHMLPILATKAKRRYYIVFFPRKHKHHLLCNGVLGFLAPPLCSTCLRSIWWASNCSDFCSLFFLTVKYSDLKLSRTAAHINQRGIWPEASKRYSYKAISNAVLKWM